MKRSPALIAALALCLAPPAAWGEAEVEPDEGLLLLESARLEDAERAVEIWSARAAADPQDFEARVRAAQSLNHVMAIRTHGNLPLVDGLQDTPEHKAIWSKHAPRALEHARAALAMRPRSIHAAAVLSTSYMFHASSLGIVSVILSGAGGEFRTNAQRVIDIDPSYEDGMGHILFANFYMVAPWPVRDMDESRQHFVRALEISPGSVRNHYGMGVHLARAGEEERARPHFEKARDLPCAESSERLFCDFIKQESRRVLQRL